MTVEEAPVVTINQGKLRGRIGRDISGKPYKSFQGIPYAKPPIGNLRFKLPEPAEPWKEDILDATKERSPCYATHMIYPKFVGSEDCLFLNVYTPKLPNEADEKLPVMVWIHGGCFFMGSGDTDFYGPEFLMAKDVVLVTLNYRLGYLGFLSLNDASTGVTGNMGLKDQVEALRWVKNNISKFGGDENNVTLFGESAGGTAVNFHMFSKMSKGLFHKAIIQSGAVLAPYVKPFNYSYRLAKALGCKSKNDHEILEFLQKQSIEDIVKNQNRIFPVTIRVPGELCPISPVIEPDIPTAFISDSTENMLLEGRYEQVPTIIGLNSHEGVVHLSPVLLAIISPEFTDNSNLLTRDLREMICSEDDRSAVGKQIKEFYWGNKTPSFKYVDNFIDYISDAVFGYKIQLTTRMMAETSKAPVYNYLCSLNSRTLSLRTFMNNDYKGTGHADDLFYLFHTEKTPKLKPNSNEEIGVHIVTTLWSNFAKTGNPNPTKTDPHIDVNWKPYTAKEKSYLEINTKLKLGQSLFKDRMEFWDKLYSQWNKNKSVVDKLIRRCRI